MKDIGLADALRYLFTGLVPLGFLWICDRSLAMALLDAAGPVGVSLLAVVWGSVTYFIYRPLLYQRVLAPLQDVCRRRSQSPRTYLQSRYRISRYEAALLWGYITHGAFRDHVPSWRKEASGIHLMYMSAVTALGFSLWQLCLGNWGRAAVLLVLGIVVGAGGFFHDRLNEDYELRYCRSLGDEKLDEFAGRFGMDKKDRT